MTKSLLLVHGVGGDTHIWDRMKPDFEAAGWACEAPTLFGARRPHHNPPANIAELGLQDYIDEMATKCVEMTKKHGQKPAIIGHSMGGLIAQVLATKNLVSKAVFLTPAQPKDCSKIGLPVLWTFANILLRPGNRKTGQKYWKTGFKYGMVNQVDTSRHDEIYKTVRYDSGRVYGDLQDGWEVDEGLVKIPTLTIAGGRDRTCLPDAVRKVGEKYARSPVAGDFIDYPEHGHWIVDEPGTDIVIADILNWLDSKSGEAA